MPAATALSLFLIGALPAHAELPRFGDVVRALDVPAPARASLVAERAPLRIQVSYQLVDVGERAAPLDAQKDGLLAAHAQLYRIIGQECEAISRSFGGDCRVVSVNLGNDGRNYGPVPQTTYTASAVFEVAAPAAAPSGPR